VSLYHRREVPSEGSFAPFPVEKEQHSGLKKFTASLETSSKFVLGAFPKTTGSEKRPQIGL
jgi:hypothetical protein